MTVNYSDQERFDEMISSNKNLLWMLTKDLALSEIAYVKRKDCTLILDRNMATQLSRTKFVLLEQLRLIYEEF